MSMTTVLTLILATLKAFNLIDVSWWLVFAPIIIDFIVTILWHWFDSAADKGLERRRNRYKK